jgi:hypothetical protein
MRKGRNAFEDTIIGDFVPTGICEYPCGHHRKAYFGGGYFIDGGRDVVTGVLQIYLEQRPALA